MLEAAGVDEVRYLRMMGVAEGYNEDKASLE
jgi:hypothetical protein